MTADPPRTNSIVPPQRWLRWLDRTSLLFRMWLMNAVFAAGIVAFFLIAHVALDLQLPGAGREGADRLIAWGAALIVGVGALAAWAIARSIRRSVGDVSAVARALAEGDLEVRYDKAASHEIGMIGASLNTMAQSLTQTLERMRADAEHERFSKEVTEAFELAESEKAIAAVVARAMRAISSDQPMELLMADAGAGAAELTQVATAPDLRLAGLRRACAVELCRRPARQHGHLCGQRAAERLSVPARAWERAARRDLRAAELHGQVARRAARDEPE